MSRVTCATSHMSCDMCSRVLGIFFHLQFFWTNEGNCLFQIPMTEFVQSSHYFFVVARFGSVLKEKKHFFFKGTKKGNWKTKLTNLIVGNFCFLSCDGFYAKFFMHGFFLDMYVGSYDSLLLHWGGVRVGVKVVKMNHRSTFPKIFSCLQTTKFSLSSLW